MPKHSAVYDMLKDSGLIDAEKVIADLKTRGFAVLCCPSSVTVIGDDPSKLPTSADMNLVYSMRHQIELLYGIKAISRHFQASASAHRFLDKLAICNEKTDETSRP